VTFAPRAIRVVVLIAVLLAVGLVPSAAAAPPVPDPDPDNGVARFFDQKLTWGPCGGFARSDADRQAFGDPRFDCTYLEVPLDYANPSGRTARIAMLRQKASDPAKRIGSLFFDPGGPGGSGTGFLPTLVGGLAPELTQRFDLIGFDPRGVGASEPVIDCSNTQEIDAERADNDVDPSPAGVAQTEAEYKDFARRCSERVGNDVLANVGTRDVARDLQIAYRVLGDQKLSYVGYSYGTQIGTEFARQFPTEVRALVLDGAIDPSLDAVQSRLTQQRGFQRAFDGFAAKCVTEPDCPVGRDPKAASAALEALLKPLLTTPIPGGSDGRKLGYSDAMLGVITAMYAQDLWPVLEDSLRGVRQGKGDGLLRLADAYYERNADGSYSNLIEAFQVVTCADTPPITDRAVALDISKQSLQIAPMFDAGLGPSDALEQCSFWPVPPTSKPGRVQAAGLPTVLVVSSTGDPATPYEDGVSLAKQLQARLLTVENDGHTIALQGVNGCADNITTRYLVDLSLPAADTKCAKGQP
jgi:pimeloyl-ACP methyl ester carboxylesterase